MKPIAAIALVVGCGRFDFDPPARELAIVTSGGIAIPSGSAPLETIAMTVDLGQQVSERMVVACLGLNFKMVAVSSIAVTFDGAPMIPIPQASGDLNFSLSLWYLPVVAGEPGQLQATWVTGVDGALLATAVFVGADPAAPIAGGAITAANTPPASISIASAPGHLTFDVVVEEGTIERTCADGSRQLVCPRATERQLSYSEASKFNDFATGTQRGAATVTAGWDLASQWSQAIVDIAPAH